MQMSRTLLVYSLNGCGIHKESIKVEKILTYKIKFTCYHPDSTTSVHINHFPRMVCGIILYAVK